MADLYFGGSFNPIHNAHLACCAAAAIAGGFDVIALVPTGQPALKNNSTIAPAADRLAMLELAAEDFDAKETADVHFRVDRSEIDRVGTTYTIDTVEQLKKDQGRINWLIGADQLLNLHRWHRFGDLLQLAQFWVMARPGYVIDWSAVAPAARYLADHVLPAPAMDISATAIRDHIRWGAACGSMVIGERCGIHPATFALY